MADMTMIWNAILTMAIGGFLWWIRSTSAAISKVKDELAKAKEQMALNYATKEDVKMSWSVGRNGKYFRCYLCGHKFIVGDYYRFIFGQGKCKNIIVCEDCDGEDALDRMVEWERKFAWQFEKYWGS